MSTEKKDWDDYSSPESADLRRVSKMANVRAAHFKDPKNRFGVFDQRYIETETVQLVPVDFALDDKDSIETPALGGIGSSAAPVAKFVASSRASFEESREWESTTATFKVQNIPTQTTEDDLKSLFNFFGDGIESLKLLKEKLPDNTWQSKGMAYVTFKNRESAEKCRNEMLYENPTTWAIHNQILSMEWAKKNDDSRPSGGGGGGGGGRNMDAFRSGYGGALAQSTTDKNVIYAGINK